MSDEPKPKKRTARDIVRDHVKKGVAQGWFKFKPAPKKKIDPKLH